MNVPDNRDVAFSRECGKQMHFEAVGMHNIRLEFPHRLSQLPRICGHSQSARKQVCQKCRQAAIARPRVVLPERTIRNRPSERRARIRASAMRATGGASIRMMSKALRRRISNCGKRAECRIWTMLSLAVPLVVTHTFRTL